jgi:hypothetical protein
MQCNVLFALLVLILPGLSHAQADDAPRPRITTEPDHLEPIYPGSWTGDYWRLYRKELRLPTQPEAGVMVYLPAFRPEECLVVHATNGPPPTYVLVHTRADKSLYYSMPENSEDGKPKQVMVKRREVALPPVVAERLCRVWDRMLRGVRYPAIDRKTDIMDGERIEFWRHGMFGQTHSPSGGAPKLFVDLGRSLINYCSSSEEQRVGALRDVEAKCRALEHYLEKQGASKPKEVNRSAK